MKDRVTSLIRMQAPVVYNRGKLWGSGADYPENGTDGWQTGAIWQNTSGAAGSSLYVNEGSVTNCTFVAVDTSLGASAGAIAFDDDVTGPLIYIETDDPTHDSYTTPFIITGEYSSEADHALVLSATNTRPVTFLFEDSGDVLGGADYRAGLFRILLTVDQTAGITLNALRAQIKALDLVDITSPNAVVAPFTGYWEFAGTGARHLDGHIACLRAALEEGASGTTTIDINLCGVEATLNSTRTYAGSGYLAAYAANISSGTSKWQYGLYLEDAAVLTTGVRIGTTATGIDIGACTTAINVSGQASTRILQYATVTDVGEAAGGHLIQYGASAAAPIIWQPTSLDSDHSGIQMYVRSVSPTSGLGMAAVRVKIELTGTTAATANAGQFWTKIACDNYTGHYLGGHPTGLSGIIEIAGTKREATSPYAVMAGVCGEVRPITATGNVDVGGVICGLHAKIFGVSSDVDVGDVVGLFVQAISNSAADIGILVQPHTGGAAWTTGLEFDSSYGPIDNGIVFTGMIGTRILDYQTATEIDEPEVGHLIQYGTLAVPIIWTPTLTCSGLDMNITSTGLEAGGFGLAAVRVKVVLTGTTKITVNAGQFWTKIACTDYTGDYLGGHPTGLSGIIELAGTERSAAGGYAVMAGVVGEVRPITCTTTNLGSEGKICGLHAKVFAVAGEVSGTGDIVGVLVQTIGTGAADIGILVQPHVSSAWTVGLEFDSRLGAITTAIDIGDVTTGIDFTGTVTSGITFSNATITPNTAKDKQALEIGGRSSALAIAFTGGAGAENFEPIQMNFAFSGTNPAATSTANIWQGGITHTSGALAALRLKWSDLLTTVSQNCTDIYIHQAELKLASSPTISGEVTVLGLVLDGGAGSPTNSSWRVINCTLRGAGTPANSAGIFINQESGCGTVDAAIRIGAGATMTSAFRIGTPEYTLTPTHLFQFPADGTSPIAESATSKYHAGTIVRISVLVGGAQYYMLASTAPTNT